MDTDADPERGYQAMADAIPAELPITKRMLQTWADSSGPDEQLDIIELLSGLVITVTSLEAEIVRLKLAGQPPE